MVNTQAVSGCFFFNEKVALPTAAMDHSLSSGTMARANCKLSLKRLFLLLLAASKTNSVDLISAPLDLTPNVAGVSNLCANFTLIKM